MFDIVSLNQDIKRQESLIRRRIDSLTIKYKGTKLSYPYGKFKGRESIISRFSHGGEGLTVILEVLNKRTGEPLNCDASRTYLSVDLLDLTEIKEWQILP